MLGLLCHIATERPLSLPHFFNDAWLLWYSWLGLFDQTLHCIESAAL